MRYFLLDRITAFERGKMAEGVKCVTLTDDILNDHFPDNPIMPGALMVESAAQLASFLFEMTINTDTSSIRRSILAQINNAKFNHFVEPGDRIILKAELMDAADSSARARVHLTVEGKKVASMTLTLVSRQILSQSVHQQRKQLYKLWTRDLKDIPEIL